MMLTMRMLNQIKKSSHGAVANMLDSNIIVSEFELQSLYNVHFLINSSEKGMNTLILQVMSI